jgi:fumarylacetoacetate (FAA) hydrolase family protein
MEDFDIVRQLPVDWRAAALLGRLQYAVGPVPVLIHDGTVHDLSHVAPTASEFLELYGRTGSWRSAISPVGKLETLGVRTADQPGSGPILLSPIDLQCVKAAGVTFATSAIERCIDERARGDAGAAAAVRDKLQQRIGTSISTVAPGSAEARELKAALIEEGLWSQYLEVAIGPDAEIFTKAPVLSTVGCGAAIGVRSDSSWNNPEPEIIIVADSSGRAVGATLGNDVNLRDFEGRSALLLGKAKDNNASCALGPFIRLFDERFTMNDVRSAVVDLVIDGPEGYRLTDSSSMELISRDPEVLLAQLMSEHHYPDGVVLFLGTLFAPIQDRDEPGCGFTHKEGDVVRISTPTLGELINRVTTSKAAAPWTFGIGDLMRNLSTRGLLDPSRRIEAMQ